ncbi:MAG: hypothetical protein FIB07_18080 [Candidatus Methanoperedens sp.]|nr:hypothetical protein [Candidatus Methanoperedens sp.]
MKPIDKILELLGDNQWHNIEEIKKENPLLPNKLNGLFRFLQEEGFVTRENNKIKITPMGLKFLNLPSDAASHPPSSVSLAIPFLYPVSS